MLAVQGCCILCWLFKLLKAEENGTGLSACQRCLQNGHRLMFCGSGVEDSLGSYNAYNHCHSSDNQKLPEVRTNTFMKDFAIPLTYESKGPVELYIGRGDKLRAPSWCRKSALAETRKLFKHRHARQPPSQSRSMQRCSAPQRLGFQQREAAPSQRAGFSPNTRPHP